MCIYIYIHTYIYIYIYKQLTHETNISKQTTEQESHREDPVFSGKMGAGVVRGVRKGTRWSRV